MDPGSCRARFAFALLAPILLASSGLAALAGIEQGMSASDPSPSAAAASMLPLLPPWLKRATGAQAEVFSRHFLTLAGGFKTLNPFLTNEDLKGVLAGPDCEGECVQRN